MDSLNKITAKEVIDIIEDVTWEDHNRHYRRIDISREYAIQAVKEKQVREENKPLTIKEISELIGKPIFCDFFESGKKWNIVNFVSETVVYFETGFLDVEDYGITWIAYFYEK